MPATIQSSTAAASGLNGGGTAPLITRWKDRGIALFTNLSTQMSQSPFKAVSVFVVVNGLFYALVSRYAVSYLDNRFNTADGTRNKRWVGLVALGTLTTLFNVGFSKLTQYQLSRVALLAITSLVVALRLILTIDVVPSHPPASVPDGPAATPPPPTHPPSPLATDRNYQYLIEKCRFSHEQLTGLVAVVEAPQPAETLVKFNEFLQACGNNDDQFAPSFTLPKTHLLENITEEFNLRKNRPRTSTSEFNPIVAFEEVLTGYRERLGNKGYQALIGLGCTTIQVDSLIKAVVETEITGTASALPFIESCSQQLQELFNRFPQYPSRELFDNVLAQFTRVKATLAPKSIEDSMGIITELCRNYSHQTVSGTGTNPSGSSSSSIAAPSSVTPELIHDEFGYLEADLEAFAQQVGAPDALTQLCDFFKRTTTLGRVLPTTEEEKRHLLSSISSLKSALIYNPSGSSSDPLKAAFDATFHTLPIANLLPLLEKDNHYKSLTEAGFSTFELASLVGAVGEEAREGVLGGLSRFVSDLRRGGSETSVFIETEQQRISLLHAMINTFGLIKGISQSSDFDPHTAFKDLLSNYRMRMSHREYRVLVGKGCTQEQINSLIDACIFVEASKWSFGSVLNSFNTSLTPLFGNNPQENRKIADDILVELKQIIKHQQLKSLAHVKEHLKEICSSYVPGQSSRGEDFTSAQLDKLVELVGEAHRHNTIGQFHTFIQVLHRKNPILAALSLKTEETRTQLIERLIKTLNSIMTRLDPNKTDQSKVFPAVLTLYQERLSSQNYTVLIQAGCPLEQLDSLFDACGQTDINLGMDSQEEIIDGVTKLLSPILLTKGTDLKAKLNDILECYNASRINAEDLRDGMECFENVCAYYLRYRTLIEMGFNPVTLPALVEAVGEEYRIDTFVRFYDFIQKLQKKSKQAGPLIQDNDKKNSLLEDVINSFKSIKARSRPENFDPLKIFKGVLLIYFCRLNSSEYYELLKHGCSQEQIDSLMDAFAENDKYLGMRERDQKSILDNVKESLIPLFSINRQDNIKLVDHILESINKINLLRQQRKQPQLSLYDTLKSFKSLCESIQSQSQSSAGSSSSHK